MRTGQFNFSIDIDLQERIERLIPKGERSKLVSKFLSEHCDKIESEQHSAKTRKVYFEKYYKPFILKYAKGRDPFYLIENPELKLAFKKSGITISDDDIKRCIEEIILEGAK